jgi:hypothetical protein
MSVNLKSYHAVQAANFAFSSASYTTLGDGAGNPIQLTITKGADSDLFVMATVYGACTVNNHPAVTLGVHDGTTDHDIGAILWMGNSDSFGIQTNLMLPGMGLLTGLGAGTFILNLRAKLEDSSFSASAIFAGTRTSFDVIEVNAGTPINCAVMTHMYSAQWVSTLIPTYETVLTQTGGSPIQVDLEKQSDTSDLLIRGLLTGGGNSTQFFGKIAAQFAGTDYDLMTTRLRSGVGKSPVVGERVIQGVSSGPITATLRTSVTGGGWLLSGLDTATYNSAAAIALLEILP